MHPTAVANTLQVAKACHCNWNNQWMEEPLCPCVLTWVMQDGKTSVRIHEMLQHNCSKASRKTLVTQVRLVGAIRPYGCTQALP